MTPWTAITEFMTPLVVVCGLAMGYGLLLLRLSAVAQPLRLRLAEEGEKYLALCNDPRERRIITFYLDNPASPWFAIAAFFLLPIALCRGPSAAIRNRIVYADEPTHTRLCLKFFVSAIAANPVFGTLVAIELLVVVIGVVLVMGNVALVRRAMQIVFEGQARRYESHQPAH